MTDWEKLEKECFSCEKCPLYATRHNVVFGTGNKNAKVMFIGEAPGEQEDNTGIPFVGRAGKLLDKFLFAVDIPRDEIYIANILKCRPPHNRDPEESEQQQCMGYLEEQIKLIDPEIIVCLGRISAMKLIKPDFKITKEHGEIFERNGRKICAVYHPSALLRDPRKKEDMLEDMQRIAELISEEA